MLFCRGPSSDRSEGMLWVYLHRYQPPSQTGVQPQLLYRQLSSATVKRLILSRS